MALAYSVWLFLERRNPLQRLDPAQVGPVERIIACRTIDLHLSMTTRRPVQQLTHSAFRMRPVQYGTLLSMDLLFQWICSFNGSAL
jgi:hypothetical protein